MTQLLRLPLDATVLALRTGIGTTRWVLRHLPGAEHLPGLGHDAPSAGRDTPTYVSDEPRFTKTATQTVPESPQADLEPLPPIGQEEADAAPVPDVIEELVEGHIETEDEVVGSFGPADDVGATIQVDEPFDGYRDLGAREVVDRLRGADPATKAAVALYEGLHKKRQTVLDAAQS
jgi:hypothetical protein